MTENCRIVREDGLNVEEFVQLLRDSGLDERRPVDQPDVIAGMLEYADLIVTARIDDRLVGVARSVTDFAYCCYLSDLAVARQVQRLGIGRALIDATQAHLQPSAMLILLSAPAAVDYYPKVGFDVHPAAFTRKNAIESLGPSDEEAAC